MADLATIARPYAEALFQSTNPAELASSLEFQFSLSRKGDLYTAYSR